MSVFGGDKALSLSLSAIDGLLHDQDTTGNDVSSPISSEMDTPGTVPNLTSGGRLSPHRVRPLRNQETQLQELKKENFGLKLRIYHLEEALRKRHGELNEDWEMNIQLNVQVDEMKQEMSDRDDLLRDAKNAIDTLEARIAELERELEEASRRTPVEVVEPVEDLKPALEEMEAKLAEAQQQVYEGIQRIKQLEEDNEELRQQLVDASRPQPIIPQKSQYVQTDDFAPNKMKQLQDELLEKQEEIKKLKEMCTIKDKKIEELELEVLRLTTKIADMITEHSQELQKLTNEISKLKSIIGEKDELLRQRDKEIIDLNRQIRELQRQLREVTDTCESLRSKLTNKEEECLEKDKEIDELRKKIRTLLDEIDALKSQINRLERSNRDKDDEIEKLKRLLNQKDEEIAQLKADLMEVRAELLQKEKALSAARTAAHSTTIDVQEKSGQVYELITELEAVKQQLKEEIRLRTEAQANVSAKDEIINQLRKTIEDLQKKLAETESKLLQLLTSDASGKAMLQSTIEELTRQLEQKEAAARELRSEIANLKRENEALKREIDRLKSETHIEDLEQQIAERDMLLEQSKHTIDGLRKTIDELMSQSNDRTDGVSSVEMAKLRAMIEAQEQALRNKDGEISSLRHTITTKDKIITDLQNELENALRDREQLRETLLALNKEKEDLLIQLKLLQDSASQTNDSYEQAQRLVRQLQDHVYRLEAQLKELSKSPSKLSVSVETTPQKLTPEATPTKSFEGSPGSTTMIIGNLSENLLLAILQKVEEVYRELIAGRSEGSLANSSLLNKMDELSHLQKQLRSRHGKATNGDVNAALLREIEALRAELDQYKREGVDRHSPDITTTMQQLEELQRENERLIQELELEREKASTEGSRDTQVLILEEQLKLARRTIAELQKQLRSLKRLQEDLAQSRAETATLRGQLESELDHNRKLRGEMTQLHLSTMETHDLGVATSLPNLHTPPPANTDKWTASSFTLGDHPDLSELIHKHREVTRLNEELQRKCEEKLKVSPGSAAGSRPASAGHASWQIRLKQQEQALRLEMKEREQNLNSRIRHLEEQLRENEERRETLQLNLTSTLANNKNRQGDIDNLARALQSEKDKVMRLEENLDQLLLEKNRKILELERKIREVQEAKVLYTPTADGELRSLRRSNTTLREEKSILSEQLNSCNEQINTLQHELELYQRLLNESNLKASPGRAGDTNSKMFSLLEEIKALRRQLEESIHKNSTLSKQLASKLGQSPPDASPPRLPTIHTSTNLKHNVSYDLSMNGHTPFVPHASSTVDPGHRTRPRTVRTDSHAQNVGMRLEDRLRQALESPSCQGMDREFIEELLLYLQQQRLQLDDSGRLLGRLEHSQDIPAVSHITVTHHTGAQDDEVDRCSSRASSVDLSLIRDQLHRTQAALIESKELLKKRTSKSTTKS